MDKTLITLTALMCFLPSVCSQMMYKIIILIEHLATLAILIWFIPALIWLLPSVRSHMLSKITIIRESFVTVDALLWFLPSVGP